SVYYENLTTGEWASLNECEKYFPASLGKIPLLIAYLKLAESSPGFLDKNILNSSEYTDNAGQEIKPKKSIVLGRTYSVKKLIKNMIVYSDNDAADLLF